MRTRNMGWRDYGMTREEGRALKKRCKTDKSLAFTSKLTEAAYITNPAIAVALVHSLSEGISFYKLITIMDISLAKQEDFDAYKRKCIAVLKELIENDAKNVG